ncbi:MAG TPA: tRNA adenosine(34) deaminase TadA [Candidatus Binataceae bacterium]|nr:tRNA adenosine(34) deaminase TadA [Candidatus Binataceae bacterium]
MARDDYHERRLAEYDSRVAEFQKRGTFGAAVMLTALEEAQRGAREGEVPVGALVIRDSRVIGAGHNLPIAMRDPSAHAEILAIRDACAHLGEYRLEGAALHVTLEPCVMCVGALLNARIAQVYYGARDDKAGALGSVYDIGRDGRLNHRIEVYGGIMAAESAQLLQEFFAGKRRT